jgi:hypothetical protein
MSAFAQRMLVKYGADIKTATQAPFLRLAGKHALGRDVLSEWLAQDRVYAFDGCEDLGRVDHLGWTGLLTCPAIPLPSLGSDPKFIGALFDPWVSDM